MGLEHRTPFASNEDGNEPLPARSSTPPPVRSGQPKSHEVEVSVSASPSTSLLKVRRFKDLFARTAFVGIFIVENVLHALNFEQEIQNMVWPALEPLPREVAVALHMVHVIFGILGASFVLVSGFDTGGRTMLVKGTSMMLVFMSTITWVWWINRRGVPYWDLDKEHYFWDPLCSDEKRNRTVHMLKNLSIIGSLTMYQQLARYEIEASNSPPSFFEGIVTSLRLWSCSGTVAPHFVLLAVLQCHLKLELPGYGAVFALLLALCAIQCSANLVNSYRDYVKGIDTKENAADRTLVDQLVSVQALQVLRQRCSRGVLAVLATAWWACFIVWAVVATNFHPAVLGLPMLGTFLAIGYTAGPAPLKYMGLGDLAIFISFGPGVIAFSSVILVGAVHWQGILLTIPVTMYVMGTLQANNHRDRLSDAQRGARTMAVLLGESLSLKYYYFLLLGAHVLALVVGWYVGCAGALGSLVVLPESIWLCFRIHRKSDLRTQDEETAKGGMMFGAALALGIVIMPGGDWSRLGLGVCSIVAFVLKLFV